MYQMLEEKVGGKLLRPGEESYEERRRVWNTAIDKKPACIVVCETEADIVTALLFSNENNLSVSIRGGGHHVGGFGVSDGGIMLDMSNMNSVQVDEERQVAIVESGATAGAIDMETQKYGLAVPTGTVSKVGVGGLALSGGLGYLRGKYGLTCDNIVAARVVTADGNVLDVSEENHPDLYWAIRGGGGNFGVVTRFEFALHPVGPEVFALDVMYDYEDAKAILEKLNAFVSEAPDEAISINLTATVLPPAAFLPEFLHMKKVMMLQGVYVGDTEEGEEVLKPLRELAKPIMDQTGIMSFAQVQKKLDAMVTEYTNVYGTSLYFDELDEQVIDAVLGKIDSAPAPTYLVQLWALGGAMNRVPSDATAFAMRDAKFALLVDIMAMPGEDAICKQWADSVYGGLLPLSYKKASYLNGIASGERVVEHAYQENYERLVEVKRKYDPDNRFCHNHNIVPE
ncbi:FAD-binding oxidoreductase [Ornithinibacillus californiensis]|uniref:FAD-binding oxidoreductase n=1 Tax=Ornithinibacillus californiensis TaxID=161536 RepID=UPI00064DD2F9|nr:FAD-binding oxidoreductase [Ornithinibacillus californiensis]